MFVRCGDSKSINAKDVEINGHINDYWSYKCFDVEDNKYSFNMKKEELSITIPIKLLKDLSDQSIDEIEEFFVAIMDKDGNYLTDSDKNEIELKLKDLGELEKLLEIKTGNTKSMTFVCGNLDDKTLLDKIDKFDLWVNISLKEKNEQESSDWDSIINEYEKFVDNYIELYKDYKNGNTSTLSKYTQCLENAQRIQNKLEKAKDKLTSSQISRFSKIANKLLENIK